MPAAFTQRASTRILRSVFVASRASAQCRGGPTLVAQSVAKSRCNDADASGVGDEPRPARLPRPNLAALKRTFPTSGKGQFATKTWPLRLWCGTAVARGELRNAPLRGAKVLGCRGTENVPAPSKRGRTGHFERVCAEGGSWETSWRTGRDSNPRYGFPYTHFPGVRLQPLGHLSGALLMASMRATFKA